jgi:CHAT domain-containing protein/tetratricopeptide (TPR) repeat protein
MTLNHRRCTGVRAALLRLTRSRLSRLLLPCLLCFAPAQAAGARPRPAAFEPEAVPSSATRVGASARETQAAAARALAAEAERLRADWAEASLRAATEKYREASLSWRAAGDARAAAGALADAAGVYFLLGEYRQALGLYRRAAAESGLAGDGARRGEALCQAGRLLSYLGDNDEALEYVKRGLAYFSAPGVEQSPQFKRSHAKALSGAAEVYYSEGDLVKSSEHLARALQIFTEVGDASGRARALLFSGYITAILGEVEKGVAHYEEALGLYRAAGDRSGEALSLTALGISRSLKLDEEEAIKLHRQAMDIFRVIGDGQSEAITHNGVGQAYQNLREHDLALENYGQALKLFLAKGSVYFASATLYQMAGVYRAKGDDERALDYYDRCARLSHAAKVRRIEAHSMNEVASIYASRGERGRALGQYRKIERFYAAVGDSRGQALTVNNMGDFFLSSGDAARALASYRRALPLSRRAGDEGAEVSTLYNIARASRDAGDIEGALSTVGQSINLVESLRSNMTSPDFRSSYFSGVRRNYELQAELLMEMERRRPGRGYAAEALAVSENARARSLLELLGEAGADVRQGADPLDLARVREVERLLRAQAQYQLEVKGGGRSEAEVEEAAHEADRLRGEYEELQARIREQNPRRASLTQPRILSLKEIQAELGDGDTLLLEYMLGSEKSYLWAVNGDSLSSYELPPRAALEKSALDLYKSLVARQGFAGQPDAYAEHVEAADRACEAQARELSRQLLGPVAGLLGKRRLLVVTEGALQYIPFDALPAPPAANSDELDEAAPLVSRHEVVSLPSVSTLAAVRGERQRAAAPGDGVSVLADPIFDPHDERLGGDEKSRAWGDAPEPEDDLTPRALKDFDGMRGGRLTRLVHTSEEADAIISAAPPGAGTAAKGFDASRETAIGPTTARSQVVHFATHGLINSEHPELSGIVLSMFNRAGGREDGFLGLQDIYSLKLSADLVVLSACETGLGKDVKGEGLVGLTRGFMYAGSRSVVASLWKVDDRATAELMRRFYESMFRDGLPPSAALRAAKEAVRRQKRWSAPYFWAAFVLQGEYRESIKVRRDAPWPVARAATALSLILLAVAAALFVWRRRHAGPVSGARVPTRAPAAGGHPPT